MHVAASVQMAQPSPFLVLHLLAPLLSRMPEVLIRTLPPPLLFRLVLIRTNPIPAVPPASGPHPQPHPQCAREGQVGFPRASSAHCDSAGEAFLVLRQPESRDPPIPPTVFPTSDDAILVRNYKVPGFFPLA